MSDLEKFRKVLLPMVKKMHPTTLANDIAGVQPMSIDTVVPMETGEYHNTEEGADYHWVSPPNPYAWWLASGTSEKSRAHFKAIMDWCNDTYGPSQDWAFRNRRWYANDRKYYFRNESDRTMFILRWC